MQDGAQEVLPGPLPSAAAGGAQHLLGAMEPAVSCKTFLQEAYGRGFFFLLILLSVEIQDKALGVFLCLDLCRKTSKPMQRLPEIVCGGLWVRGSARLNSIAN